MNKPGSIPVYTLERLKMLQKRFMGMEMSNSAIRFLEWIERMEKEEKKRRRVDQRFRQKRKSRQKRR